MDSERTMKVAIISLESINNAGDEILGATTEFLLKRNNISVKRIELDPKDDILGFFKYNLFRVIRKLSRILLKNKNFKVMNSAYKFKLRKYFQNELKDFDAVVMAIGMLKYTTQDFSYLFELINEEASRKNIPVLMSAMSIALPDETDERYHQLVRAVNLPAVKMITTRDGERGIELLKKYYIRRNDIFYDYVGDPALWIPECYGIRKKESDIVGIGLVRKEIFIDYGKSLKPEKLANVYIDLIKELEKRKINWVLFSNGIESDYAFGAEILEELGMDNEKLLRCPNSARELISDVSDFQVILGARLHACITAFSLGVPVVGLLWDDKLVNFSETMGIQNFFISEEEMDGKFIADKLIEVRDCKINEDNKLFYKRKTQLALDGFCQLAKEKNHSAGNNN